MAGLRGSRDNARHARNNVVYNLYVIFACAQKYHRYDVQTTGYTTPNAEVCSPAGSVVVLHRPVEIRRSRNSVVIPIFSGYIGFDLIREPIKSSDMFFTRGLIRNPRRTAIFDDYLNKR